MNDLLAYIDPGSGTILLQLVIAAVIGLGVYFRNGVNRVLRAFKRS